MVKAKNVLYYGILLSILLNNYFFHIISSDSSLVTVTQSVLILVLLFISIYCFTCSPRILQESTFIAIYLVFTFICVVCFQLYYCILVLHDSISTFIESSGTLIYLLLVVPIFTYLYQKGQEETLLKAITNITVILLSVLLVNTIIRNFTGASLLPFTYYNSTGTRAGRLRVWDVSVFSGIAAIFCFYHILEHKNYRDLLNYGAKFSVVFLTAVYVEQTRMEIIALLFSCAMMLLRSVKNKRKKVLLYVVVILATIFGLAFDNLSFVIGSFSVTGQYGLQTTVRLYSIGYCIEQFLKSPIFGYGITTTTKAITVRNLTYLYSHIDVGAIGSLARLGLPFLGFYCWPMLRFLRLLLDKKSRKCLGKKYCLPYGLFCYLCITSISLLVTDAVRIYSFPFYIALFEFYHCKIYGKPANSNKLIKSGSVVS